MTPSSSSVRYERIIEGRCPIHATALAREDPDYGRCVTGCNAGWSWHAHSTWAGHPAVWLHRLPGLTPTVGALPTTFVDLRHVSTAG